LFGLPHGKGSLEKSRGGNSTIKCKLKKLDEMVEPYCSYSGHDSELANKL
jgi:hypothetical protein